MSAIDYEPLLLARLRACLAPVVVVDSTPALDDLLALEQRPLQHQGCYLMKLGSVAVDEAKAQPRLRRTHRWAVIVAVRNRAQVVSGAAARAESTPLCDAVIDALHGWSPAPGHLPLRFDRELMPVYQDGLQLDSLTFIHDSARVCG
jgi:hypothetical protein